MHYASVIAGRKGWADSSDVLINTEKGAEGSIDLASIPIQ